MSSSAPPRKGAVSSGKISDIVTGELVEAELSKLHELWREFGKLLDSRDADALKQTTALMRARHGRMELLRNRMLAAIEEADLGSSSQHLYAISVATSHCRHALTRVEDCENTLNELVLDIGSRDVPIVGSDSDDDEPKTSISDDTDATMVLYKMEGCPACINFQPIWKQFVKTIAQDATEYGNVRTVSVTSQVNPELCAKAGVNSFPTVRLLQMVDGKPVVDEYLGGNTVAELLAFVADKLK